MSYFDLDLLNLIPHSHRALAVYYPDINLFKMNKTQYALLWQLCSQNTYLYTNGYEIKPVSWFVWAYQSLKGWFGYNNYCEPTKISYTLSKLAYYGYTQGFPQPNFLVNKSYSISSKIQSLAKKSYSNDTSAAMQTALLKAYFNCEPQLPIIYNIDKLTSNHAFGLTWLRFNAADRIPILDPQNEQAIQKVINILDGSNYINKKIAFLPESKYAKAAGIFYYNKAMAVKPPNFLTRIFWYDPKPSYLSMALSYDSTIAKQNPEFFIEHYVKQKDYKSAMDLLALFSSTPWALKKLLSIPQTNRMEYLTKDSPLAVVLATHHLAKKEYSIAKALCSDIKNIDPVAGFTLAVNNKAYKDAYEIFCKFQTTVHFPSSQTHTLARIYFDKAEEEYAIGKAFRDKNDLKAARRPYLQSLWYKKAAYNLVPSLENLENTYIHNRLYAQILIDLDIIENPIEIEKSDLPTIIKAIKCLHSCHSCDEDEKKLHKQSLSKALMRQIDCLKERVSFHYNDLVFLNGNRTAKKNAKIVHIKPFIAALQELIALTKNESSHAYRSMLGKAHYLLADLQSYFDLNAPDTNEHYRKALEAMPNNPFYMLRYAEVCPPRETELRDVGIPKLKELGFKVVQYIRWSDERWLKKTDQIGEIKDIHFTPETHTPRKFFSFMS